jgi:ribosome-associated heat shock protein Hsp15
MGRGRSRNDPAVESTPHSHQSDTLRLDKWIWFARFQRSREACAELVRKGHVRIQGRKVNQPGAFVRVGDVLTLALPGRTIVVEITALAERRSDSEAASVLYRSREANHRESTKIE